MRTLLALLILAASCFGQVIHVFPATDTDNTFTGSNRFNKSILLGEATCTAGASVVAILCADATHQLLKNLNGAGLLNIVGIATPATAGRCPQFAANGIDLVDSGSATCGGGPGTVTNIATGLGLTGGPITGTGTIAFLPQYAKLRCEAGLGDGLNAMAAGTYLQFFCINDSGVTWTITGIHCWTDNAGASTLNAANNAGTGLLTGAVTCNNTKASGGAVGTQSGTTTLANGDAFSFTFVADGTSKQTTWTVSFTQ